MGNTPSESSPVSGYCRTCRRTHQLGSGSSRIEAERLSSKIEEARSIDLFRCSPVHDEHLSTAPLFGEQRGKMFGVLHCLDAQNRSFFLYAFSGQFNGRWLAPGWVPPLFDVQTFQRINDPVEKKIKELGRESSLLTESASKNDKLAERKELSRRLMTRIHELYRLNNFRGEQYSLYEATGSTGNLATGIGDCCAPKLLSYAASQRYKPVSLTEFYFGRDNLSGTRRHNTCYQPCSEKCLPLLGFLLCGLDSEG